MYLIDCCLLYRYRVSYLYPAQKGYNQTRLGLEFQSKQNPYTKLTLTTMEGIKLFPKTDRYTTMNRSMTPALFFMTFGKPSPIAIDSHQHQSSARIHHYSWTWPYLVVFSSAPILIGNSSVD